MAYNTLRFKVSALTAGISVAVLSIRTELGLPVKFIGVGEKIDDMQEFDAEEFVTALFE